MRATMLAFGVLIVLLQLQQGFAAQTSDEKQLDLLLKAMGPSVLSSVKDKLGGMMLDKVGTMIKDKVVQVKNMIPLGKKSSSVSTAPNATTIAASLATITTALASQLTNSEGASTNPLGMIGGVVGGGTGGGTSGGNPMGIVSNVIGGGSSGLNPMGMVGNVVGGGTGGGTSGGSPMGIVSNVIGGGSGGLNPMGIVGGGGSGGLNPMGIVGSVGGSVTNLVSNTPLNGVMQSGNPLAALTTLLGGIKGGTNPMTALQSIISNPDNKPHLEQTVAASVVHDALQKNQLSEMVPKLPTTPSFSLDQLFKVFLTNPKLDPTQLTNILTHLQSSTGGSGGGGGGGLMQAPNLVTQATEVGKLLQTNG